MVVPLAKQIDRTQNSTYFLGDNIMKAIEVKLSRMDTETAQEILERNINDCVEGGFTDEEIANMGMGYLFCLFDLGLINEFQLKYLDQMVLNEYRYR